MYMYYCRLYNMDNGQLHIMLKRLIGRDFDRVFSRGNKVNIRNNKYYVFNTEIWPKTGHFISLYCCGSNIYVFDSLGVNNIDHHDIICQKTPNMIYLNNKKLQSTYSSICSLYCIFFIYHWTAPGNKWWCRQLDLCTEKL